MRRFLQSCLLFTALLFIAPLSAQACSCIGSGLPCQAFWNTSAVFSGEVKEIIDSPNKEVSSANGQRVFTFPQRKIRLAITEAFRGISGDSVEINTGRGGGDCGYNFKVGQSYLVYAYKNPKTGELGASICSRTQLLEKAAEDINYFRSLATAKSGSTIYGNVKQSFVRKNDDPYKEPAPLSGIPVTLEGITGKIETKTDKKGEYRLTGLPAGDYQVRLKVPQNLWGYSEAQKVKVYDKGCADSYFALQTKTILSGKLLNEKSESAAETSVELVSVEQLNQKGVSDRQFAYTNAQGEFIFRSIPSGKYYLGIRFSGGSELLFAYPQTFYPGTLKAGEAKIITINEGDILENYDFKLPKKLSLRKVEGVVVFPDGTPAANANLTVNETEYFYSYAFRGAGQTKPDGTFSFDIIDGIRYLVQPYVSLKDGQHHAEPIEIPTTGSISNLKFVITEPGGGCEKCRNWKRSK